MERLLVGWVHGLCGTKGGVIAIDGKAVSRHETRHMVSAYAHEAGLVLAARATAGKGREIAGIADILDMLLLEGMIVTTDALGTQSEIVETIVRKKSDYMLALKGNQVSLYEDVTCFFADPALLQTCAKDGQTNDGHQKRTPKTDTGALKSARFMPQMQHGWAPAIRAGAGWHQSPCSKACGKTRKHKQDQRQIGFTSHRFPRTHPVAQSVACALECEKLYPLGTGYHLQ